MRFLESRGDWWCFAIGIASEEAKTDIRQDESEQVESFSQQDAVDTPAPPSSDDDLKDLFTFGFGPSEKVFGCRWHSQLASGGEMRVFLRREAANRLEPSSRICPNVIHPTSKTLQVCAFPMHGNWYRTLIYCPGRRSQCCGTFFYALEVSRSRGEN